MRTTSAPGKAHASCMIRPRNETDKAASRAPSWAASANSSANVTSVTPIGKAPVRKQMGV